MGNYVPNEWVTGTCVTAERMNNIETGVDEAHKELQHPATFIIAASNSTSVEKVAANYVCDGVADDVQIQAAIDAAVALGAAGGKIRLLSGTYYLNTTIYPYSNTILEGVGHSTIIKATTSLSNNTPLIQNKAINNPTRDNAIVIRDLTLDGNCITVTTLHGGIKLDYSDHTLIERVYITNLNNLAIHVTGNCNNTTIHGCDITDCILHGIMNDALYTTITGNYINGLGAGLYNAIQNGTSGYARITGNVIDGGRGYNYGIYTSTSAPYCIVSDNIVHSCRNSGIYTYNANYTIITNNHVYSCGTLMGAGGGSGYGLHLNTANNCIMTGNISEYNEINGMFIDTSTGCIISNNILKDNCWNQDNVWTQLNMAIDCDRNLVTGNMVRQPAGGAKPKYGIYNYTGNLTNIIVHNDLYDSAYTALQDNGTTTVVSLSGNQTT